MGFGRSRIAVASHIRLLLLLGLLPLSVGCPRAGTEDLLKIAPYSALAVENKSLVLVLPPDSKEIRIYYVLEGISVAQGATREEDPREEATALASLKRPEFMFFTVPVGDQKGIQKNIRFDELRFLLDKSRKRQLCADRKAIVANREMFARWLNAEIPSYIKDLREINRRSKERKKGENAKETLSPEELEAMGLGPFLRAYAGLVILGKDLDEPSMEKFEAALKDGFDWVQFGPETIRIVFPATPECARRIAGSPRTAAWVKGMESFVTPLRVEALDGSVALVIGKKGEPIRLSHSDTRRHRKERETALIRHADALPLLIGKEPANGDRLVEQFLMGIPCTAEWAKRDAIARAEEAKRAAERAAERLREVPDEKAEADAMRQLRLARILERDGLKDKAAVHYQEIIKQFPETKAGKEAKELLEKLKK